MAQAGLAAGTFLLTLPEAPAAAQYPPAYVGHETAWACLPNGAYYPYACKGKWDSEVQWAFRLGEPGATVGGAQNKCNNADGGGQVTGRAQKKREEKKRKKGGGGGQVTNNTSPYPFRCTP